MKNYELNYIVSPDLSEEDVQNLSEKIINFIQEETGLIEAIKKSFQKNTGFLVTLNLSLNPEKLANLEKKLKTQNQILRYLILAEKTKIPEKKVLSKIQKPSKVIKKIIERKKVELKDIDKKIEEILSE